MEIDLNNITIVQKLTNSKEVSEELKLETIKYIGQLQKLVNDLSLQNVSESLICDKCKNKVPEKHDVEDLKGNKLGIMCNDCIIKLLEDKKLIHVNYSH